MSSARGNVRKSTGALGTRPALGPRYQLGEAIGQGGMSQVFRALDRARDEQVAVKVLNAGSQGVSLGSEFRYIASLDHPGVVKVHDFGLTTDGRPYFTMELLDAGNLLELSEAEPVETVMQAARAVFKTLSFVHARGIIHGDLKPSNILIGTIDDQHYPKLLDFGIAWDRDDASVQQGGTAHFMAPELIVRGQRDHRSDLYAMGVVMYLLLTGSYPFEGEQPRDLLMQHLNEAVPDPRDLVEDLDGELAEIPLRLLEKRAEDRFQTAREVALAIDGYLGRRTDPPRSSMRPTIAAPKVGIAGGSRFVGLEGELRQLLLRAVAIPSDGGGLSLLSGESGAGKTRLLQELRIKLQLGGIEYISTDLRGCRSPKEVLERIGATIAGAAGNPMFLLHQLVARDRAPSLPSPLAEQLIVEAERLAKGCELLSLARPTVLAIEGLDAVPDEALRALSMFVDTVTRAQIVVVVTHTQSDCRAAQELTTLDRATGIELRRLGLKDSAQIVRSLLGEMEGAEAINEHVYRESGGNPGAIERVVRALAASDAIVVRAGRWVVAEELGGKLPQMSAEAGIRAIARALIDTLAEAERAVAEAAAHIDERFDVDLLRVLFEGPIDEQLKRLCAAQVLEPEEERAGEAREWARYRFAQRAVRELLRQRMPAERAREQSQRVVSELERRRTAQKPFRPEVLARHLMACGRLLDAAEIAAAEVVEASASGADSEAADVLRQVLGRSPAENGLATQRWCELAMDLGDMDRRRGAAEEAITCYRAIVSRSGDADAPLGIRKLCAASRRKLGDLLMYQDNAAGERLLIEALEQARGLGVGHLVARAAYSLADHYVLAGRHEEASKLLFEALSQAGADDRDLKARTLRLRARSHWMCGRFGDAEADARAAAKEYEALGSTQGMAVAIGGLGNALYSQGRLSEARAAYVDTLGYAKSAGWLTSIGKAELNIATIDFYSDDWDGACEHWQSAIAIAERTGNRVDQVTATYNVAYVAARRGEYKNATRLYERALSLAQMAKYPKGEARVRVDLAQMSLERGHLEEACEQAAHGIEVARAASVVDVEIAGARRMLELSLLDGREYERVVSDGKALLERAEKVPVAEEVPHIRRVLGEALARAGNRRDAQRMFVLAEHGFEKFGSRYEAARVVRVMAELAGEGLLPRGKLGSRLREVSKLFRRLRAQPELDLVRGARTHLGDVKDVSEEEVDVRRVGSSTVPPHDPEPVPSAGAFETMESWPPEDRPPSVCLADIMRELTGILELDRLLERLVDAGLESTGAERGLVIACDRAGNPRVRVSRGIGGVDLDGDELELSKSVVQQVMLTRARVVWHRSIMPPAAKLHESVVRLGLCAVVGMPMLANGELIGMIYLDSRAAAFEWDGDRLDQLAQLAEQAAMALVNARKYDEQREKTELITAAVRELRDPLDAALGYVDRLKHQLAGARSPVAECVQALSEQTGRLEMLLSRLLEVANGDPAELGWSMVSIQLKELIETALVPVRALATVAEVDLSIAVPRGLATIFGNRERLIRVVETLTGEAVRASAVGAQVTLHVTPAAAPPGMPVNQPDPLLSDPTDYELSRDHVVRIEVAHEPRAEAHKDDVGLAIARKIVTRHGGLMWSDSHDGIVRTVLTFPVLLQKSRTGAARA